MSPFPRVSACPGAALAETIVATRFSTPVAAKLTEFSLRLARGASSASISRPNSMTLFRQPARRTRALLVRAHDLDEVRGSEDPALGV